MKNLITLKTAKGENMGAITAKAAQALYGFSQIAEIINNTIIVADKYEAAKIAALCK